MKKTISLILTACLILTLAACSGGNSNTNTPTSGNDAPNISVINNIEQFEREFEIVHSLIDYNETNEFTATATLLIEAKPISTGLRVESIVLNIHLGRLWKFVGNNTPGGSREVALTFNTMGGAYSGRLEIEYDNTALPLWNGGKDMYFDRYSLQECTVIFTDSNAPATAQPYTPPPAPVILQPAPVTPTIEEDIIDENLLAEESITDIENTKAEEEIIGVIFANNLSRDRNNVRGVLYALETEVYGLIGVWFNTDILWEYRNTSGNWPEEGDIITILGALEDEPTNHTTNIGKTDLLMIEPEIIDFIKATE